MKADNLRVGTSGWSYPDWRGGFYPREVPPRRFLEYYTTRFAATELNASFYRLPRASVVEGWLQRTPPDFRFAVKLSRLITHYKRLLDCGRELAMFFDRFRPLRERMGVVLAQLPPTLGFESERVRAFCRAYGQVTELPLALEARHDTWQAEAAAALLAEQEIALVRANSGGHWPELKAVTGRIVYLRWHGPGTLYSSGYSPQQLGRYATQISAWLEQGRQVWAFFNNTDRGHAWRDAEKLRALVQKRRRP